MMRKTSLILLGAAAGAALTLFAVQPRVMLVGATAKAAAADTYRQLNLFGDVLSASAPITSKDRTTAN